MQYTTILNSLQNYSPPEGWSADLFLLPPEAEKYLYDFIITNKPYTCIELGTGFGATACIMAAAMEELGRGQVITIDMYLHQPVNVNVLMQQCGISEKYLKSIVDPLGYNWYLADLIKQQSALGICQPLFDFCLLDGAHEWNPDALAFFLISKLLKPGAWIALDDINFNLRMIPNWRETHPNHSDRELDTCQIGMIYDLVVSQHPEFTGFKVTHNGRIGWAKKKLRSSAIDPSRFFYYLFPKFINLARTIKRTVIKILH
jgi:predicted O-methyltransferase YrrM